MTSGRIAVIGAGAWGTALATVLARQGRPVGLWVYEAEVCGAIATQGENPSFLPGVRLPPGIEPTRDYAAAVEGAAAVVFATPSHALRAALRGVQACLPATVPLVLATKGLELGTHFRVSQQVADELGAGALARTATLSGPTFARELAAGEPAAIVIASNNADLAARLQADFSHATLRLYTSGDVVGVELSAALKNVIAIAAGICHGLGLGSNTRAALIARGLAEIGRLVEAAGGQRATVAGLAGLGDLVLTCTGELSRNRSLGVALGQGGSLSRWQAATPSVAEGVTTTTAALALAAHFAMELPITEAMQRVLFEGMAPRQALHELMTRRLKAE